MESWVTRPSAQLRTRRVTTTEYEAAISRRWSPEVCIVVCPPREERAQGRPGACCTRGLACDLRKQNCTRAYRAAGAFRPSLRNGFTAYFVLSPVNGSFATVVAQKNPPQLDASTAASGPHDFTVRVSQPRQSRLPRPSHPTARFVTIASRPSCRVGRRMDELICMRTKGEYFCAGCWTNRWRDLPDGQHRHW